MQRRQESGFPRSIDFLDLLKERAGIESDYALAKRLEVTDSAIGHYRNGRSALSRELALKVAAMLDLPAAYVLACAEIERSPPQVRKVFERIAETFEPDVLPTPSQRPLELGASERVA